MYRRCPHENQQQPAASGCYKAWQCLSDIPGKQQTPLGSTSGQQTSASVPPEESHLLLSPGTVVRSASCSGNRWGCLTQLQPLSRCDKVFAPQSAERWSSSARAGTCLGYLVSFFSLSKSDCRHNQAFTWKTGIVVKATLCLFTTVPLSWVTMCIMPIYFGAKINHCSLLRMLCGQKWLLLLSFDPLVYVIESHFWHFDFCTSKFVSNIQIYFLVSKDFSLNFFALQFININMLKLCLLSWVW